MELNLKFLTAKDISCECSCSLSRAKQIYKEIKTENNLHTKPTYQHLINYLGF